MNTHSWARCAGVPAELVICGSSKLIRQTIIGSSIIEGSCFVVWLFLQDQERSSIFWAFCLLTTLHGHAHCIARHLVSADRLLFKLLSYLLAFTESACPKELVLLLDYWKIFDGRLGVYFFARCMEGLAYHGLLHGFGLRVRRPSGVKIWRLDRSSIVHDVVA